MGRVVVILNGAEEEDGELGKSLLEGDEGREDEGGRMVNEMGAAILPMNLGYFLFRRDDVVVVRLCPLDASIPNAARYKKASVK